MDFLREMVEALRRVELEALVSWPYWGQVGLCAAVLACGLYLGWRLGRRNRVELGPGEVLLALERVARRDFDGAFRVLEDATYSADAPPEIYLALASVLRGMGHVERSAQLHRALTLRPSLEKVMETRAVIGLAGDYLTLGRSEEAEALLGKLPSNVRRQNALLALRRNAALRARDWKEALAAGGLLARSKGGDGVSEIYGRMAEDALSRGDESEATRNFKRALSESKTNVHASEGLARIYLESEKFRRARQLIEGALEVNGNVAPRLLPLMRVAVRSRDKYRDFLIDLIEAGNASPWAELELAEVAYSEEDFDEAGEILSELVERFPRSLDVREAYLNLLTAIADERTIFTEMDRFVALSKEELLRFRCGGCDHTTAFTFVTCPQCGSHGTVQYSA